MNFIKIILAMLGVVFLGVVALWILGAVWSLFGWAIWIGVLGAVAYGGYRLFTAIERRALGKGESIGSLDDRDYSLSWEEYDRKYLNK
jgi:hypothetical protein